MHFVWYCVETRSLASLHANTQIIDDQQIISHSASDFHLTNPELRLISQFAADWMASQKYAQRYFKQPNLLASILPNCQATIVERFRTFLNESNATDKDVVAVKGVGSMFGFLKVKGLVDHFAPLVQGRLLVFFPGSYEDNNYRLLDGYDGWNYLAIPITADKE